MNAKGKFIKIWQIKYSITELGLKSFPTQCCQIRIIVANMRINYVLLTLCALTYCFGCKYILIFIHSILQYDTLTAVSGAEILVRN